MLDYVLERFYEMGRCASAIGLGIRVGGLRVLGIDVAGVVVWERCLRVGLSGIGVASGIRFLANGEGRGCRGLGCGFASICSVNRRMRP